MNSFCNLLRKITSSPYHHQMLRFAAPLKDCFGINHFWYFKITFSGNYSYLGTHHPWNEYCFENAMVSNFPCLRHPNILQAGVNLMKAQTDPEYQAVLNKAWEKFQINFNINLIDRIPDGIEAFGFATCYNDPQADQRLINKLPLLIHFTKAFKKENKKLFHILDDNQVNLPNQFGPIYYERQKTLVIPHDTELFLKKMGFGPICSLTHREKDILKFISQGYPSKFIAKQLQLSYRTVENYISTIKDKLSCNSKVELITKASEVSSTGYFDNLQ